MSDGQKLKDSVSELSKANRAITERIKEAAEKTRQARQEQTEQSNR